MSDRNRAGGAARDPSSLAPIGTLIDRLRRDCPWDRELSLRDLRAYLIEEAHELAAAIDERDPAAINEELGDLLFEAVYVARLASAELSDVPVGDAIRTVIEKMVARHPHVFGDEEASSAAEVAALWEQRKRDRAGRSVLDGVPASLPALVGAYRLGQKAAGIGFDWDAAAAVRAKVSEELEELDREMATDESAPTTKVEEELGDVLFAVANLARHLKVDPERALASANRKFRRRFAVVEAELESGVRAEIDGNRMELMERLWERAKREEE
ncbi:MAG: nucleoside triphosphate pyrophosphohydrolase [Acidobacteria bacterium]|nr:nucleoside triphosphate pyrophosphohydrolase [Acidobacteriota bacterium]